jgi:hypothetical protein
MTKRYYVTIAFQDGTWGVGELIQPESGEWWVDVKRSKLQFADAADLRDVWQQRQGDERP